MNKNVSTMKTMNNNVNIKPFNFNEAIKGAKVVTRLGLDVKVITATADGKILARVLGRMADAEKWNIDGSKYSASSPHFMDLFLVA